MTEYEQPSESVVFESTNGRDISQVELDELADATRVGLAAIGERELVVEAVAHEALGAGNHWHDILNIFLPGQEFVKDAIWDEVLRRAHSLMRERFSRNHEHTRPRVIVVRQLETGEILSVQELSAADAEWIEVDQTQLPTDIFESEAGLKNRLPPPPPSRD